MEGIEGGDKGNGLFKAPFGKPNFPFSHRPNDRMKPA